MIVVLPVSPPWSECVSPRFSIEAPDASNALETLYEAAVADVASVAEASSGQLLVNYRDEETLPETDRSDDPVEACRALVDDVVGEDVRFERQVGSTPAARLGNTVTHLLEQEEAAAVCVLDPLAPLVRRSDVDGVPMKVRRDSVILGPDGTGDVYLAAFTDPIDFTDACDSPVLSTLADRAREADRPIGFTPTVPRVTTDAGIAATSAAIDARRAANEPIPEATAAALEDLEFPNRDRDEPDA